MLNKNLKTQKNKKRNNSKTRKNQKRVEIPNVSLLKKLCSIHSPSGQEEKTMEFLVDYVKKHKHSWAVQPKVIHNDDLKKRTTEIESLRRQNKPPIPTTIEVELKTNIFFRLDDLAVRKSLSLNNATDLKVFTKLRKLKDNF